jgi:hypothetical protein
MGSNAYHAPAKHGHGELGEPDAGGLGEPEGDLRGSENKRVKSSKKKTK